jgi:hypothetical protein
MQRTILANFDNKQFPTAEELEAARIDGERLAAERDPQIELGRALKRDAQHRRTIREGERFVVAMRGAIAVAQQNAAAHPQCAPRARQQIAEHESEISRTRSTVIEHYERRAADDARNLRELQAAARAQRCDRMMLLRRGAAGQGRVHRQGPRPRQHRPRPAARATGDPDPEPETPGDARARLRSVVLIEAALVGGAP